MKEHAFTVQADTQGPNSTNSLRTVGTFFQKEKEELTVWSMLLWDIPMRGGCAQPHAVPRIPIGLNTFPQMLVPHLWHHA